MAQSYDTLINPPVESLLDRTDSKFVLVTLASKRSREITNYLAQVPDGVGAAVPPQVVSASAKPLSIALEEIAVGRIVPVEVDPDAPAEDEPGAEPVA